MQLVSVSFAPFLFLSLLTGASRLIWLSSCNKNVSSEKGPTTPSGVAVKGLYVSHLA